MQEYTVRVYKNKTEWLQNGQLHRLDGPAMEWTDGSWSWWKEGKLHRLDGPAFYDTDEYIFETGKKDFLPYRWYIEGVGYTEEEFNKYLNKTYMDEIIDRMAKEISDTLDQQLIDVMVEMTNDEAYHIDYYIKPAKTVEYINLTIELSSDYIKFIEEVNRPVELTMEEISDMLGFEVKIVKD